MTAYSRGDVVLDGFIFADESGRKHRHAVIISSSGYHRPRQEVVVAAITSNVRRRLFGDSLIRNWREAGLLFPSVVAGIIRTIKGTTIHRKLGSLAKDDLAAVERELRQCRGL